MATHRQFPPDPESHREPSPPAEPVTEQSHRHRHLRTAARIIFVFVIFPILLGACVLLVLVNSQTAHNYLLRTLQQRASESLGVPVHLQNFALHLTNLSVDLYGLTVAGANPYPNPPLLQLQHGQAGVRIVSILQRKWYLDSLQFDHPVIQIYVDDHGNSNIPKMKSSGNSNNNEIFDLGIRRAVLTNGELYYNNQPSAIAFDVRNFDLNSSFDPSQQKYSGTLGYTDGQLFYGAMHPPAHSVSVEFDATPATLHITPAKLTMGNSQLTLNATVNNYSAPVVQAQYQAVVDAGEVGGILHNPSIPTGLIAANGTINYQQIANRALLDTLQVAGDISSKQLNLKSGTTRADIRNVLGHYTLANGNAIVQDLRASLFGGELTAHGTMKNLSGDSHSDVAAALRNISLADLRRAAAPTAAPAVNVAGTVNATATASWGKTLNDLIAHTDANIQGSVTGTQHATAPAADTTLATPVRAEQPHFQSASGAVPPPQPAASTANQPLPNTIPIQAAVHADYNGKSQLLALRNSFVHTPQTSLNMNGAVSSNSALNLQLRANDLHELEAIADLFRTPAPGQPLHSLGLAGTASFQGTVRGSTAAPHLTGQLSAQNLQVNGSSWKVFRGNIDASPSQVSLQQADLQPATRGRITASATVGLNKWAYSQNSPVQVQLQASNMDLAELTRLASQQIPATGTLNANVALHGTQLNPVGNGNVSLTGVTAYNEPVQSVQISFSGTGDDARANLAIRAPAGNIDGNVSVRPHLKTYTAQLTSSGIQLDKLASLKASAPDLSGVVAIKASGQGSFTDPGGEATIDIPKLVVQKQTITGIHLQANMANHVAVANLTSSAVNTNINAHARIALTGDYPADATLDTQSVPLGPILAAYAPAQAANISGRTELHATLHGPLKDKTRLEAHVTIPVLRLAYTNSVQLAAVSPIHIDYKDQVINIQRSAIRGTDTDLQFQGSIPTTSGTTPLSVLLLGTVNLELAQLVDPDLRTSGQLRFNINSYGSATNVAGTVNIVDANLASGDLPAGLQHANGTLTLAKDRINITSFQGTLGGGAVTAQGGVALRPAIQFDMGLAAKGVRLLYPQGMREGLDANLRFTGTTESSLLGGTVSLTDLSFTRGFDLNDFISQFSGGVAPPPTAPGFTQTVGLNIALRSANNVNLVSRTLSIGGSANLQVRGSLADPVILGRANLTGGDIILNGNRYVLSGGTVQFVNPAQTEPVVNLNLTTVIQQYNINLRFSGPVEQLQTQYTSDPSLPSADIVNLLAFGKTREASAQDTTPATQNAENIIASQVSSQVTSRVSKIAGISQLSINPVLGNSSNQGPPGANVTIQQRITGNLFVTFSTNVASAQGQTIQGQYQVSPRVSVSATRSPNGGFAVDTQIKKTW